MTNTVYTLADHLGVTPRDLTAYIDALLDETYQEHGIRHDWTSIEDPSAGFDLADGDTAIDDKWLDPIKTYALEQLEQLETNYTAAEKIARAIGAAPHAFDADLIRRMWERNGARIDGIDATYTLSRYGSGAAFLTMTAQRWYRTMHGAWQTSQNTLVVNVTELEPF